MWKFPQIIFHGPCCDTGCLYPYEKSKPSMCICIFWKCTFDGYRERNGRLGHFRLRDDVINKNWRESTYTWSMGTKVGNICVWRRMLIMLQILQRHKASALEYILFAGGMVYGCFIGNRLFWKRSWTTPVFYELTALINCWKVNSLDCLLYGNMLNVLNRNHCDIVQEMNTSEVMVNHHNFSNEHGTWWSECCLKGLEGTCNRLDSIL